MAQLFQFGGFQNRNSTGDLEHYRLQIKKLKQINTQQSLGYQKKIESLQKMLKGQGFGNFGQTSQKNQGFGYQPASNINQQILKRDKQINRLSEQNQRLRKHGYMNPDHNLIAKKRGFFDQVADKDAQIIRLKKTIYQLQSKYDGKYYNDARVRNQYTILQKQNENLRKQVEASYNTNRSSGPKNQINSQLLQGIKYKKQRDMLEQEVKNIANQYKKLDQEYGNFRSTVGNKVVANTEVELLRKQMQELKNRNNQLIQYTKHLQAQNQTLKQSQKFNQSQFPQNIQTNSQYQLASPQRSNAGSNSQVNDQRMSGSAEQKRRSAGRTHNIFGPRTNSAVDNKVYNQTRHQSEIEPFRLQQHQQVNSQIYQQRQQNNSPMINGRPMNNQNINHSNNNVVNDNKIQNGDGRDNLVSTEKKTGFYDRFGLDSLIRDKLK